MIFFLKDQQIWYPNIPYAVRELNEHTFIHLKKHQSTLPSFVELLMYRFLWHEGHFRDCSIKLVKEWFFSLIILIQVHDVLEYNKTYDINIKLEEQLQILSYCTPNISYCVPNIRYLNF